MTEYNFEHSRRVSKTVKSLHRDLQSMTSLNNDLSESPTMQYPANRPSLTKKVRISQIPYEQSDEISYKVLPSSTMSPKNTKISVQDDNGNVKILELERVNGTAVRNTIQSYANNGNSIMNNVASPRRTTLGSNRSISGASPNRKSLFGSNFQDGQASLSDFPLLHRIPIIGQEKYNSTIKELRTRINSIQNLSLQLHRGADENLFDILQKKVVKLSQSGRVHQHELDGMRLEIEYLLNEIISQQKMREELYSKLDGMEESKKELLQQIREANSKLHQQNGMITEWRTKHDDKFENVKEKERMIQRLSKRLTYQEAEIDHGKKITEQNLTRLQQHIKKISDDLRVEKEANDSLRFKLNGANLKIHKFKDDVKDLQGKVTFFEQFKEKSEKQQEQIAELTTEISDKNAKLEETKSSLETEKEKNHGLNEDILQLRNAINTLENTELSLNEDINSLTKELESTLSAYKSEQQSKESEINKKDILQQQLNNERQMKDSLETDYNKLSEAFKEKINTLQDEIKDKDTTIDDLRQQYKEQGLMYEEKLDSTQKECRDTINKIKSEYIQQCTEYENRVIMVNKENDNLQNALTRIQADYKKLSNIWEHDQNTIKNMSAQMDSARNRIDKLVGESHKKSIKIEEYKLDVKNSKNECGQLNKMMMNKDKLIESQSSELSDLRKRVNELLDLLDNKDQTISTNTKDIKKLNLVKDKYHKLLKQTEELKVNNSRLHTAIKSEKEVTKKLDEKLKSSSKSFSEMISKDQEELNKLNKLLKNTQKECNKKNKKAERLSITMEDIKRNFNEERELLQDTIDRLKRDYENLKVSNDSSKELWEKRVKCLNEKLNKSQDNVELREKEIMRMSIDLAKIKSHIAVTAQSTYSSHHHQSSTNAQSGNSQNYLMDQLNQQKHEIHNLYSLLNDSHKKQENPSQEQY